MEWPSRDQSRDEPAAPDQEYGGRGEQEPDRIGRPHVRDRGAGCSPRVVAHAPPVVVGAVRPRRRQPFSDLRGSCRSGASSLLTRGAPALGRRGRPSRDRATARRLHELTNVAPCLPRVFGRPAGARSRVRRVVGSRHGSDACDGRTGHLRCAGVGRGSRRLRSRRSRRRLRGGRGSGDRCRSRSRLGLGAGRRRRRDRRRGWGGRRRGCRRRVGSTPRREQAEWVDVRVGVADPNAEMDVGRGVLGLARRAGVGDRVSLRDRGALADAEGAEMSERGPVSVGCHDGDRQTVRRDRAGERDLAGHRRPDRRCPDERDVDAAMLTRRVLVVVHEERAQDRSVGRPVPPQGCGWAQDECPRAADADADGPPRCPASEHGATVARVDAKPQCS